MTDREAAEHLTLVEATLEAELREAEGDAAGTGGDYNEGYVHALRNALAVVRGEIAP